MSQLISTYLPNYYYFCITDFTYVFAESYGPAPIVIFLSKYVTDARFYDSFRKNHNEHALSLRKNTHENHKMNRSENKIFNQRNSRIRMDFLYSVQDRYIMSTAVSVNIGRYSHNFCY